MCVGGTRPVMNILISTSILFLATMLIIHSLEFGLAKATNLSMTQNTDSNMNIMTNETLQSLNNSITKSNSNSTFLCSGSKSINASGLSLCQEETSKASPEEFFTENSSTFTPSAALIAKD